MKSSNISNNSSQLSLYSQHEEAFVVKDSAIHGKGLFTMMDIPKNVCLITYEGELIGKSMSDKRERLYRENNQKSIYMFKINEDLIIDATMVGNKARYINHSCEPNCYTRTSNVNKKIRYFSFVDIPKGAELTINYNLSGGDSKEDICTCGAATCKSKR